MNDQQLIELLQQKTPEELSLEEIELLRSRLAESPELRDTLTEQLKMESYLAEALGRVNVSVEEIFAKAGATSRGPGWSFLNILGIMFCSLLIAAIGTVFVVAVMTPPEDRNDPAVVASNDIPSDPKDVSPIEKSDGKKPSVDQPQDDVKQDTPTEPASFPLAIEAENFARSNNVVVETTDIDGEKLSVIRSESSPSSVEYEFDLPRAGKLLLKLRYASFASRPLRLTINGRVIAQQVAGLQSGGNLPESQKWFTSGEFLFVKGKNVICLSTKTQFPYLDQIVIADPTDGQVASTDDKPATSDDKPPAVGEDAPKDEGPKPPWHEVVQLEDPLPGFEEICFDDFNYEKSLPQRDDLQQWFAPVAGAPFRITNVRTKRGQCAAFDGLARLKSPWLEDSALRLSLESYHLLKIHFFHKQRGLTLIYYQSENDCWAAYTTTRQGTSARPETFALTATDADRNRRTEIRQGGPFEIRYRQGEVILSRGDVVLMRAPLDGPPEQVFFEGRAAFHGIALVRTKDFPPREEPRKIVADMKKPAELNWIEKLGEGAQFEKLSDGSVRLTSEKAKTRGWVAAPLPKSGLHEVIVQIEDATPGSGLYLGSKDGEPSEILRFQRNQNGGATSIQMRSSRDEVYQAAAGTVDKKTVAQTGETVWIKLLYGAGTLRWWMSSDGIHWAPRNEGWKNLLGGTTHLGLHHVSAAADCRMTLRRITVRQLQELSSLADEQLLEKAPAHRDMPNVGSWLTAISQTQPANIDTNHWRRACAIRALSGGCPEPLGRPLVGLLLDDAAAQGLDPQRQLRLLNEATLLLGLWDNPSLLQETVERYRQIGMAAFRQADERPFSVSRSTLMTAPIAARQNIRVADPATIRAELLQLLGEGNWQETITFCRRLRFFQQHQQLSVVDWAETIARRRLPRVTGELPVTQHRQEWRHPLEEKFNKETYNVVAEMQAVLDSDAFEDAARMITSIQPESLWGVAPHAIDRQLLVSLPAAIRLAARQYPGLKEEMDRRYGEIARLRIRRAIATGDVDAVQLACVQFETTESAAEAHRWLGDRALSSGWFVQALSEYRRAAKTAGAGLQQELAARIRLTAAMLGSDEGNSATGDVQLGESKMSAAEFETLVADMRKRNVDSSLLHQGQAIQQQAVRPSGFVAHRRSRLDGKIGQQPSTEVTQHVRRYGIHWADRQLATVVEGDVLYVSNRFAVSAYDLTTGERKWQSANPPGAMLRSQEWALTAMRPLLTQDHIYVRMLYGTGPLLVCLDKSTGQVVWATSQRPNEFLISDPVLMRGQMAALSIVRTDQRISVLRMTKFDVNSGEPLEQHELLRLRDVWWSRRLCSTAVLDDAIVANLGGLTICCDLTGKMRWVRKHVVLPIDVEPNWVTQYFDPPLLHDGRLYVTQPGVRSLSCLDPDSGGLYWSAVLPNIRRLVGVSGKHLIVRTDEGFHAVDIAAGKTVWTHRATKILNAQLCGGEGGVLYCRRQAVPNVPNRYRPELVWLDSADGRLSATTELKELENTDPRLGPFVAYKDRLWTFSGNGQDDANRDVVELVPQGNATVHLKTENRTEIWTSYMDAKLRAATSKVLPQWRLLNGHPTPGSGLLPEMQGEKEVLAVGSQASMPVVLARRVEIPATGRPRLRMKVAGSPKQSCKISVIINGKILQSKDLTSPDGVSTWHQFEVDLSNQAGQSGWLIVRGEFPAITTTFWKTLELVY